MNSHIRILALAAFLASAAVGFGQTDTTTVNWFNDASTLLRNSSGTALSQGNASLNTDGMLVQLGYFSTGTAANNFSGTWTPLTGATAPFTTIGDSSDLAGSGNGMIQFSTFFHPGTTAVQVYLPVLDPGAYATMSSVTVSLATPPPNQVLAIRFYDTANTTGHYNTVSSDTWLWQSPAASPVTVTINLAASTLEWESVAQGFSGTEFKTVLPIPEPSTYALFGLGAVGMMALRRRVKR
jgi:PEP-CTERM motif-containing protein